MSLDICPWYASTRFFVMPSLAAGPLLIVSTTQAVAATACL